MSALAEPLTHQDIFEQSYLPQIQQRSLRHFSYLDSDAQAEAVQDCIGQAWMMYVSATARGKASATSSKGLATPCSLTLYANRLFDSGRRFAGTSSTDAMADGTRVAGRAVVASLDAYAADPDGYDLADVLADRRLDNRPLERVRVDHDYRFIIKNSSLSPRANQVWRHLLKDWGPGHVTRIAKRLKVSPGRVCQAKTELAGALESWDYRPYGWKRSTQGRWRRALRQPARGGAYAGL